SVLRRCRLSGSHSSGHVSLTVFFAPLDQVGRGLSSVLAIICCLAMSGCGVMMIVFHKLGLEVFRRYEQLWEMTVGILVTGLLGTGGILLLIREVRRRLLRVNRGQAHVLLGNCQSRRCHRLMEHLFHGNSRSLTDGANLQNADEEVLRPTGKNIGP